MIIEGKVIVGIFVYSNTNDEVIYTTGDKLLFEGLIYKVISNYSNKDPQLPNQTDKVILDSNLEYVNTIDEFYLNADTKKLIPTNLIFQLLRTVIDGLEGANQVKSISSNQEDLNDYTSTGFYCISGNQVNSPHGLDIDKYLFRVYSTEGETYIIQEIVDSVNANIFYRTKRNNSWNSWVHVANSNTVNVYSSRFNELLDVYYQKIQSLDDTLLRFEKSTQFHDLNSTSMSLANIEGNIKLMISYEVSNVTNIVTLDYFTDIDVNVTLYETPELTVKVVNKSVALSGTAINKRIIKKLKY